MNLENEFATVKRVSDLNLFPVRTSLMLRRSSNYTSRGESIPVSTLKQYSMERESSTGSALDQCLQTEPYKVLGKESRLASDTSYRSRNTQPINIAASILYRISLLSGLLNPKPPLGND